MMGMPARSYRRISNEDRNRIINAFEDPDRDYKGLARSLKQKDRLLEIGIQGKLGYLDECEFNL